MTRAKDLARLLPVAGLIRDLRLADVARAAAARQHSLTMLDALEPRPAPGLDPLAEARAGLLHQVWAGQRRAEILPVLDRQTGELNQARDNARLALGRAEVLDKLSRQPR